MENRAETMLEHWKLKFETAYSRTDCSECMRAAMLFLDEKEQIEFLRFCISELLNRIERTQKKV